MRVDHTLSIYVHTYVHKSSIYTRIFTSGTNWILLLRLGSNSTTICWIYDLIPFLHRKHHCEQAGQESPYLKLNKLGIKSHIIVIIIMGSES